jgi:C-methyltransferase C-terminal domain/Putative zinc binding domain/Methyltransferase domain
MVKTRQTCRVCGSPALTPVISLGDQCLASNFALSADFPPVERKIPLELVRCDPWRDESACGLVQLRQTVPSDLMYSSYGYRSGINQTMARHLAGIARGLEDRVGLQPKDLVVDIGANDGTLLLSYQTRGARYVGFEPSDILPEEAAPHLDYVKDYFSAASLRKHVGDQRAKIVTSIAMFYDLESPNSFVADVAEILADDGLWTLELSYLPSMLDQGSFDTICHEHLEYYSLSTIENLLARHGLSVADAELNDSNGGSIRVTVCHRGSRRGEHSHAVRSRIYGLKKREFEMRLDTDAPYRAFSATVERIRSELGPLIESLRASGKTVYGYGASTKGNVILQYCGLGPTHVTAIADRNPAKWGGSTLGSNIPIVSEDEMRRAKPDFLLVLPWHFLREFRAREEVFLARGGRFIVPVPKVEIVG